MVQPTIRERVPKHKLVLCELHNSNIHGFDENSDPTVSGHYLLVGTFKNIYLTNYNMTDDDDENVGDNNDSGFIDFEVMRLYRNKYRYLGRLLNTTLHIKHPLIRNYNKIIQNVDNFIKPEIAQIFTLNGGETVVILKTFWLRIVQRAWKRVFAKRQEIMSIRMSVRVLSIRQLNRAWPENCRYMPSLDGMLVGSTRRYY